MAQHQVAQGIGQIPAQRTGSLDPMLLQHGLPQNRVDAGLITFAVGLEPQQYIGVNPHGGGLFGGFVQMRRAASGLRATISRTIPKSLFRA